MRATRLGVLVALAVAAGCGDDRTLPATLTVEEVVVDLSAAPPERAEPGVTPGVLDPGDPLRGDGARASLIVPPGRTARWRIPVARDTALRFGVGVEGAKQRDEEAAGLRFRLAVGGREAFTRTVNPATDRHHRRWFDERVDLDPWAGGTVEVTLAVEPETEGRPAGTAGWSRLRVVRETAVARERASPERPNVLVLLVDTLRADAVGAYGTHPSPTPALDALAARGTLFTQAVAQSSWTLPSVASLLTGLPPRRHRATGEREEAGAGRAHARWGFLGDHALTWAEAAARRGITTFGASANPLVSRGTNLAQGFETFVELPWDPEGRNWATAEAVNEAFESWLRPNREWRFAAYLHYMEPHDPYTPPAPPAAPAGVRPAVAQGWIRDLANRVNFDGGPPLPAAEIAHLRALYAGEVAAWDRTLAALLDRLAETGGLDRTLVVVTADHGEEFQEHGRLTHGSHLYEETVRVPLVVAGPGVPVARRDDLAQGIDLFPTLARPLGLDAGDLPGRDLLAGPRAADAVLETASGIGPDGAHVELVALRSARWKLIETPALGRRELYDLASDAAERVDRTAAAAEATALLGALARWRDSTPPAPVAAAVDPAFAAKLRALGYTQ